MAVPHQAQSYDTFVPRSFMTIQTGECWEQSRKSEAAFVFDSLQNVDSQVGSWCLKGNSLLRLVQ